MEWHDWLVLFLSGLGAIFSLYWGHISKSKLQDEKKKIDADLKEKQAEMEAALKKQQAEIDKELKKEQAKIDKDILRASGLVEKQSEALQEIYKATLNLKEAALNSVDELRDLAAEDNLEKNVLENLLTLRSKVEFYGYLFDKEFLDSFKPLISFANELRKFMRRAKRQEKRNIEDRQSQFYRKQIHDIEGAWDDAIKAYVGYESHLEIIREKMREISGVEKKPPGC